MNHSKMNVIYHALHLVSAIFTLLVEVGFKDVDMEAELKIY